VELKMRNLKRYLNRRKIMNVKAWAKASGITSIDELSSFCKEKDLYIDVEQYINMFNDGEKPELPDTVIEDSQAQPAKVEQAQEGPLAKSTDATKTWHTPAAKRPLKKPSTKVKTAKVSSHNKK
tara:strand:+ start:466 stop:837 length:372 start_codon:yes stop_codon:yes gene_type:complete